MPTLKIKDIKPEYAAKEVRDASGNVLSWDLVLLHYPNYEILVKDGKPLEYENTPSQDYRFLENIVKNDPNGPYAATNWLLGQQVMLPLGAIGAVTAPVVATVGGIAGGVGGDILGNYASDWLFNNPDKEYKLNQDITITPRTATRLGGSLVGGIAGGAGAHTALLNVVKPYLISREIKRMPLTGSDELPSNVGWGPKQTITVSHKSDSPESLVLLNPERYDVVNEGANPLGIWYLGKLGIPRTVNAGATLEKATKAQRARKLFDDRPFTHKGDLTLEKPLVTIGEVPNRSTLSHQAEKLGADGIIYNGVYDNGYNNNLVILSFKLHTATPDRFSFNTKSSKLTEAEKQAIENLKSYSINSSNFKSNYLDDNGNWNMSKIKDDASLENVWKALNGTFYTLTGAAVLGIPYIYAKKSGGSLIPKHQIGTVVLDKYYRFCGPMYHALYKAFKNVGKVSENLAMLLARYATYQMANESGYGTSRLARELHNYGGMKNGNKGWQKFNSMEDFANQFVRNQMKNFKETLSALNYDDYIDGLFDYQYLYAPDEGKELYNSNLQGVLSRVDSNIDKYINGMSKFYKSDMDLNSDNLIFKTRSTIYDKPM